MMKKKVAKHTIAYFVIAALLLLIPMYVVFSTREKEEKTQVDILFLGDSLIGQYRDETSVPYLVGEALGKTSFNGAFGGSTMTWYPDDESDYYQRYGLNFPALVQALVTNDFAVQKSVSIHEPGTEDFLSVIENMSNIDFKTVEVVVVEYGTNDYFAGAKIESGLKERTFKGSFSIGISNLKEKYPHLRIVVVGPTYSWYYLTEQSCEEIEFGGGYLSAYVECLKELCAENGIEYINLFDLYNHSFSIYESNLYTEDGIHPNTYGRQLIADEIVEYLEANP